MQRPSRAENTLGSVLRYFEDEEVVVELKNGRRFTGVLEATDQNMAVVLSQARSNSKEPQVFPMMHIRGSQIRYMEFVDKGFDFNRKIKHGISRERSAAQRYKRGVRK